jgi:hypothetical protein
MMRFVVLIIAMFMMLWGDDNITDDTNESNQTQELYIDQVTNGLDSMHEYVSHKLKVFSSNVDAELSDLACELDEDNTTIGRKTKYRCEHNASASMSEYVSDFFRDETFLDVNNRSYLRMRLGSEFSEKEAPLWQLALNFNLNLPYARDSLNLFVGEDVEDEISEKLPTPEANDPSFGLRYFIPDVVENFKSNFTVGTRGINPYARIYARYNIDYADWRIYPIQEIEYRGDNTMQQWGYYERTRFYFDRKIAKREMVRFMLYRSTEEEKFGQRYGAVAAYFNTLTSKHIGYSGYLSVGGDSRFYKNNPNYLPKGYEHSGIDTYRIGSVLKQRLYKEWLFYEIEPIMDWSRQYHFDHNAMIKFNLEFWFGDVQKIDL